VNALRALVGGLGIGAGIYGAIQLLDLGLDNLRAAVVWLIGGVVLHDGVLAPLTIAVCFLVARAWRGRLPAPVVVGAVVLATVTLTAVPVLGRFGARPDNPTLLDRNYVLGWLGLATLTIVVVVATTLRGRMRGGTDGTGTGRR
jgi:xanthine/uracil permease